MSGGAVRWAIRNTPAMNTIVAGVLLIGAFAGFMLRREVFPQFELEIILVTVPYPGASPDEVESGICQKVEEAVRSVDGIKKLTSVALEGAGNIVIELHSDVPSVQKVMNEIESQVARIPSFPELSEEPEVQQITFRNKAITVGIVQTGTAAAESELQLRRIAEEVRDDLLQISEISQANIQGERDYQIDVEIEEAVLRQYGLTLADVAAQIRSRNLELPGGTLRDQGETYLLRGKDKRVLGEEIASIPLITRPGGAVLRVKDLGRVKDEFTDVVSISEINGQPGLAIDVNAASREDLLAMTAAVREYTAENELPAGYEYVLWGDTSKEVRDRLDLLLRNGMQGLILVFIILALFLELKLAFWVALGIPISLLGACAVLWQFDQTLNMLSLFSFLIALGIVVDDAIVVGENIYTHRTMGKSAMRAAIDGTVEVIPSVVSSVTTTIFAFMPMFFVSGVMGKFFAVMPLAVIAILALSLLEACFVLPCHLSHGSVEPSRLTAGINRRTSGLLQWIIRCVYQPVLKLSIRNPAIAISSAVCLLMLTLTLVTSGKVQSIFFPKLDAPEVIAKVIFPDGTPSRVTDNATRRIEAAIQKVNQKYSNGSGELVKVTHRMVGIVKDDNPGGGATVSGGHAGTVYAELADSGQRSVTSEQIVSEWRAAVGEIAGVERLTYGSLSRGPGGSPIEFKLLAPAAQMDSLEAAVQETKEKLATYEGVFDVADASTPGKWEIQLREKPRGVAMGIPLSSIARTVRASYYGEEVMRLQRGRHEVKLMVRYPENDRRSLARFDEIRVDGGDGVQRPITELVDVNVTSGYSEINRIDQKRSITISSDIDERQGNAKEIVADLQANFMPGLLRKYPGLRVRWEGQQEQDTESVRSLGIGMAVALLAMYVLLTVEFTSYGLPLVVMAVIPFGMLGAVVGHWFMGLPLTLFSILGIVALTGIVVNDSIVLVDFINHAVRRGVPLQEAVMEGGIRRFRPVLLTSLTTIAGLSPILTETSFQAQLVIPMATSICFGLVSTTVLVLVLVPVFYFVHGRVFGVVTDETELAVDAPETALAVQSS